MKRSTGQLVRMGSGDEAYHAFVPAPLPPVPSLKLTVADHDLIERASRALGKLDGMTSLLPNTALFIYAYVRKEALVSSATSFCTRERISATVPVFSAAFMVHENAAQISASLRTSPWSTVPRSSTSTRRLP